MPLRILDDAHDTEILGFFDSEFPFRIIESLGPLRPGSLFLLLRFLLRYPLFIRPGCHCGEYGIKCGEYNECRWIFKLYGELAVLVDDSLRPVRKRRGHLPPLGRDDIGMRSALIESQFFQPLLREFCRIALVGIIECTAYRDMSISLWSSDVFVIERLRHEPRDM